MKFAGFAKLVVTLIFRAAGVLFYLNMERFLPGAVMLVLEKIQALPLGVLHMQGQYRITTTLQSAGAFLLSLPCIIFFSHLPANIDYKVSLHPV